VVEAYEVSLRSKAFEKFVGVDNADLKLMFEAYCDSEGKLDFDDAVQFAGVVQGGIINANIGWVAQLMDKSIS
jgi:hypothetical protein